MEVKKLVKGPNGSYQVEGEISEDEHTFIFNIGLYTLLENGAVALQDPEEDEPDFPTPGGLPN